MNARPNERSANAGNFVIHLEIQLLKIKDRFGPSRALALEEVGSTAIRGPIIASQ